MRSALSLVALLVLGIGTYAALVYALADSHTKKKVEELLKVAMKK